VVVIVRVLQLTLQGAFSQTGFKIRQGPPTHSWPIRGSASALIKISCGIWALKWTKRM